MSEHPEYDLVIGIDVGTTGTKAMVLDVTGAVLHEAYFAYGLDRPEPLHVEQDPEDWWRGVVSTVRECAEHVNGAPIRALAVSAQGGSVVAVDEHGIALAPARSWLDRRASAQAREISDRFGKRAFFERTGWRLYGAYNAVQLMNMRDEEPQLFADAAYFLSTADYINFRLTGLPKVDRNSIGITQLASAESMDWDPEILEFIGIDRARLSEIVTPGEQIGHLTVESAAELGLNERTMLVAGGHDQYCAALGAGVIDEGDLLISTGTAWVVLGISEQAIPDPVANFGHGNHVVSGRWGNFGSFRNGGVCLDWARSLFGGKEGPISYEDVDAYAAAAAPGAEGVRFFPHFDGTNIPDWSDESKGSFLGMELRHGQPEFITAVLEGICFELRRVLQAYGDFAPRGGRVRLLGGAAKSPAWTQMIADILNEPVEVPRVTNSACVGAAILAAVGTGAFADAAEAYTRMSFDLETYAPGEAAATYETLFKGYLEGTRTLRALYESEAL